MVEKSQGFITFFIVFIALITFASLLKNCVHCLEDDNQQIYINEKQKIQQKLDSCSQEHVINKWKVKDSSQNDAIQADLQFCHSKRKKYFFYDVNPSEGFNLRRDVYVRIAPIIHSLNKQDLTTNWILVLPPWGNIPHWRNPFQKVPEYMEWSSFFDLERIRKFIPAIELSEFLRIPSARLSNTENTINFNKHKIDEVFQLQHFPFDPNDKSWSEKILVDAACEEYFPYTWDDQKKGYVGSFWGEDSIYAGNATCMSLRGQSSTIVNFLSNSTNFTSIMFDRAEVILWDSYGDVNWWLSRASLRFSPKLTEIAKLILIDKFGLSKENRQYLAIHLRRRDFIYGRRKELLPSITGGAAQAFHTAKRLKVLGIFLATDSPQEEIDDFRLALKLLQYDHRSNISFFRTADFPLTTGLHDGQIAVLDQILCSWAKYFIGTPDSTFTLRIFEERELDRMDPDSTFNYVCPDPPEVDEEIFTETLECNQPVKWLLKTP